MEAALQNGLNLMAAERPTHDVKADRERRVAKGLIMIARIRGADGRDRRLFRIDQFGLRLRQRRRDGPVDSLDRCMAPLLIGEKIEADRPDFDAWPERHGRRLP
jgi:hypothetical protein